jgi:hypothetical protein
VPTVDFLMLGIEFFSYYPEKYLSTQLISIMETTQKKTKKGAKDKYSNTTSSDFSGTQGKEYAGNRKSESSINDPGSVRRLRGLKSDTDAGTTGSGSDNRL